MPYRADGQEKPGQGADTLRIWAASVDYTRDVSIGPNAIKHASESLRKIRSAMRFLLANTSGEKARAISDLELGPVRRNEKAILTSSLSCTYFTNCPDSRPRQLQAMMHLLSTKVSLTIHLQLMSVLNSVTTFLSSTLSSFYFDAVKETLYCDAATNPKRLAIIAVLHQVRSLISHIDTNIRHPTPSGKSSRLSPHIWQRSYTSMREGRIPSFWILGSRA